MEELIKQLKRIAIGVCVSLPFVAVYFIASFFVDNGYVSPQTISLVLGGASVLFMCWSLGGAYESIQEFKRTQTDIAFRKLGHKD